MRGLYSVPSQLEGKRFTKVGRIQTYQDSVRLTKYGLVVIFFADDTCLQGEIHRFRYQRDLRQTQIACVAKKSCLAQND